MTGRRTFPWSGEVRGERGRFLTRDQQVAAQAPILPEGWSLIARQQPRGGLLRWAEVEGAVCNVVEAQALVACGLATTAQRRDPDGLFSLLVRPLLGGRRS